MPKLHELKRARTLKSARLKELLKKEADLPEDQVLDEKDAAEATDLTDALRALDERIARCETALEIEATEAKELEDGEEGDNLDEDGNPLPPVENPDDLEADELEKRLARRQSRGAARHRTYAAPAGNDRKGFKAAQFLVGYWHAKHWGSARRGAQFVSERFGANDVAKALNTTGTGSGGALIPQAFSADIIELLRANTVVRNSDPFTISMPGGNLTIPRLAAGASAGYQGELDDIGVSEEKFDDVQLNAKKLTAMVPVSNDLIRRAPSNIEQIVRDDLIQTLGRREDLAFLTGDGSGNSPVGLLNLCSSTAMFTTAALPSTGVLTFVTGVLNSLRLTLEQNMSRMIRPVWIGAPAAKFFLMGLRDDVGDFYFKDELEKEDATLLGVRFRTSQQLPTNLNTGTSSAPVNNGSYLFLVDMADVILADTYNIIVDASDVASYADTAGNQVSAFRRDQTVFRVISEHDFNLRHQASLAVATLAGWAPPNTTPTAGSSYFVQPQNGRGSAAPSTWGTPPTGSNNPGNSAANAPGGTQPGLA